MIDVFITHYIPAIGWRGFNEIVVDQIKRMRSSTSIDHRAIVVYHNAGDACAEEHLTALLPEGAIAVRNDRPGRSDIIASLRNKSLDLAREMGSEIMISLHNDVRPAKGWLEQWIHDLYEGEAAHGVGNVIISPRHIPYHFIEPEICEDAPFWETLQKEVRVLSSAQIEPWARLAGFEFVENEIWCPAWAPAVNTGHQLMMWCTRPAFFDAVGPCDEAFTGVNYDDVDWGMRALIAGKTSLTSQSALIGHIESLTFGGLSREHNIVAFTKKWGRAMFDEMITGDLWPRLRKLDRTGPLDVIDIFKLVTGNLHLESIIDVGTGLNGVVGLAHWDQLKGAKYALDIHSIKALPAGWGYLHTDARSLFAAMSAKSVDVIQACDFIEHLTKSDATRILVDFERAAKKAVLLFTPNGFVESPAEKTEPNNPYQKHLCGFSVEELEALGYTTGGRIEATLKKDAIVAWKIL